MTKTAVVLNDLQIPFQDNQVVYDLALPFVRDLQPDLLLLNGDIADCYALTTKHDRLRNDIPDIDLEIVECARLMDTFGPLATRRVWLGGNHEFRLDRYLAANAKELGRRYSSFDQFYDLKDHGFEWIAYTGRDKDFVPGVFNLGKLTVTHGFLIGAYSGLAAKKHFDRLGTSVLHGHTHRLGVYYKTNLKGVHGAWENGCLCITTPEYAMFPDWQHGLSVVTYEEDGFFSVQQLPIIDRRLIQYGKERYEIKRKDRKR